MKKVLNIIGTRPEAIKMAPIIRELRNWPEEVQSVTCLTGQHTTLLSGMLDNFDIVPQYNIHVVEGKQLLSKTFAKLITNIDEIIHLEKPDWIVAQGDTMSVVAASMLAYYNKVKFGHVEAGLRTGDLYSPYPEEGNRLIADLFAKKLWAPTIKAADNLFKEGYGEDRVNVTGNTVIDALLYTSSRVTAPQNLEPFKDKKNILVTVHRRESFGENLLEICSAIRELSVNYSDVEFIYPVHPNPNVHDVVHVELKGYRNIHLIPPLGYTDFIWLLKHSYCVLTDSGGVQEEAPSLNIPVIVLRDKTERPEGIEAGVSILAGRQKDNIIRHVSNLITDRHLYQKMAMGANPYGDGKAALRIVEDIINAE